MSEIIAALKPTKINQGTRIQVYEKIIAAFESHDCDTLMECMGEDAAFDRAYRNQNASEDGFQSARDGKELKDNPHKKRSDAYRDWESGWMEYRESNPVNHET